MLLNLARRCDFVGMNIYSRFHVAFDPWLPRQPDVALLDLAMPRMNRFQATSGRFFCRRLKGKIRRHEIQPHADMGWAHHYTVFQPQNHHLCWTEWCAGW